MIIKRKKLYFNIVSEIPKWLSITVEHFFQKTVNIGKLRKTMQGI